MKKLDFHEMNITEGGNGPACGASLIALMGLFALSTVVTGGAAAFVGVTAAVTFGFNLSVCG